MRVNVALPEPTSFVAVRVTLEVPVTVGVPLMSPVLEFTLRPAGKLVAPKLVGPLLAVI